MIPTDVYPLPLPPEERTCPEDYIPKVPDESGEATKIWLVMQLMRLSSGRWAGRPFHDVAQPWQRRFIHAVFGPRPESPHRNHWVSEVLLSCAKKNGKTSFLALVLLARLLVRAERDARYYLVAGTQKQADTIFQGIRAAVEQDAKLLQQFHIVASQKRMLHRPTAGTIEVTSFEKGSVIGAIVSSFVVDELHDVTKSPNASKLIGQLSSGLSPSGGLGFYTTTRPLAGTSGAGLYTQIFERHRVLHEGESKESAFLSVVFEPLPESSPEQLHDPATWWRSNPGLGVIVQPEFLQEQLQTALISRDNGDPGPLANFEAQHLNVDRSTSGTFANSWAPSAYWPLTEDPAIPQDIAVWAEAQRAVWGGFDAGGLDDLSALVLIGEDYAGRFTTQTRAWLTQRGYSARVRNQPVYDAAIERGELTLLGDSEYLADVWAMIRLIESLGDRFAALGIDSNRIAELSGHLTATGIVHARVEQNYRFSGYIQSTERAIAGQLLHHRLNEILMPWCLSNVAIRVNPSNGNVALEKADETKKIDTVAAMVMCWAISRNPDYIGGRYNSAYEQDTACVV